MLTTAQQKVKQELEELQINALVYHNEKTIIPRKSHSLKKWMFMIISILVLNVACSLLIKGYWTQEQAQLVSYLTTVDVYNEQNMMTNLEDPKHSEQQLNKYLIELSVKQELAVESLTKGFEKEKIKYLLRENGTIQYWIKSKSYDIEK
jgi:type IV secretory pathway TrbF-like protein